MGAPIFRPTGTRPTCWSERACACAVARLAFRRWDLEMTVCAVPREYLARGGTGGRARRELPRELISSMLGAGVAEMAELGAEIAEVAEVADGAFVAERADVVSLLGAGVAEIAGLAARIAEVAGAADGAVVAEAVSAQR